jgi:toxin YoeB
MKIFINQISQAYQEIYPTEEDLMKGIANFMELLKILADKKRIKKKVFVDKEQILDFIDEVKVMLESKLKEDLEEEIINRLFSVLNAKNWKQSQTVNTFLHPNMNTYCMEIIPQDSMLSAAAHSKDDGEEFVLLINWYNDSVTKDRTNIQFLKLGNQEIKSIISVDCADNAETLKQWFRSNFKPQNAKELFEHYTSSFEFSTQAIEDITFWEKDEGIFKRIIELLDSILVSPFDGLGKPEGLKNDLQGYWSRRIDQEHRLIYKVITNQTFTIITCKGHYDS